MWMLNCPKHEELLEYVSIREVMGFSRKLLMWIHLRKCTLCFKRCNELMQMWHTYFAGEPEITVSLMRVLGRLQRDETLILKGWKIGNARRPRSVGTRLLKEGWVYRGALGIGMVSLGAFVLLTQIKPSPKPGELIEGPRSGTLPIAKFRQEEKNRIRFHYLQPELMHSVEFETAGTSR